MSKMSISKNTISIIISTKFAFERPKTEKWWEFCVKKYIISTNFSLINKMETGIISS